MEQELNVKPSPETTEVPQNEKEKLDKEEVLRIVKKELEDAREAKEKIDAKIAGWMKSYNADLYGNETEGRSKFVSRDAKKTLHWYVPNMLKPFMASEEMMEAVPVTGEDVPIAQSQTALLNYQFARAFPRYQFLHKSIFSMALEGTVVARTGWISEEEDMEEPFQVSREEYLMMTQAEEIELADVQENFIPNNQRDPYAEPIAIYSGIAITKRTTVSKPTADVIKNEDFFIDPKADSLDDAQFCIQRIDTTLSDLREQDTAYNPKGIYTGVDSLVLKDDTDGTALSNQRREGLNANGQDDEYESDDKSRKNVTIYEYYGNLDVNGDGIAEPIVCVFSGNKILRLASNPFPDEKPPFVSCAFSKGAFGFWGDSLVEFVEDIQKLKTAILRTTIDTMANSNNRMKHIQKGSIDALNHRKLREARIGSTIEWNDIDGFKESEGTEISSSILQMYELFTGEIENESGMTRYSQGIDGKSLNKTATGISAIMNQSQMRIWETSTRFAEEFLKPLFRKWIAYNQEYLDQAIAVRVKGDQYTSVSKDDMGGEYDLTINVALAGNNEQKAQNLVTLMQMSANIDPRLISLYLKKLAELWDFQDIATQIEGMMNGNGNDNTGAGMPIGDDGQVGDGAGFGQPPQ